MSELQIEALAVIAGVCAYLLMLTVFYGPIHRAELQIQRRVGLPDCSEKCEARVRWAGIAISLIAIAVAVLIFVWNEIQFH